jgi:hypothetical protein
MADLGKWLIEPMAVLVCAVITDPLSKQMRTLSHAAKAPSRGSSANRLRPVISIGLIAGALCPPALFAAPLLRCQVDQGGTTTLVEARPGGDPYRAEAIDINGHFRFKAVAIGDAQRVEYINLYVYGQTSRQPVLLHQVKYLAPLINPGEAPTALTGINYVYLPKLERQLQYSCTLQEKTP